MVLGTHCQDCGTELAQSALVCTSCYDMRHANIANLCVFCHKAMEQAFYCYKESCIKSREFDDLPLSLIFKSLPLLVVEQRETEDISWF